MKKFTSWLALCFCASLLAACGGGGGSPGTITNGATPSKAASIVLTSSAATIASSGAAGTEVTLTAIVKDANNATLANETVSFKTSSGNIAAASATTDATGTVTAKLNVQGDSSLRAITITASDGSVTSNTVTVNVVSATQTISLTTDSGTLPSSGAAGTEVTVTAVVRDASNSVLPNVPVTLSSDSGSLTNTSRTTDATGKVTEKLSTGGDPSLRTIKLTASVPGAPAATAIVTVVGTTLTINASSTLSLGASADITVTLVDSAGNALFGKPVSFSTSNSSNSLSVKGGGQAVTNPAGQLILTYQGNAGGGDAVTVKSLGASATAAINVNASSFAVAVQSAGGAAESTANIGGCQIVAVSGAPSASVSVSSSLGYVYSDAACSSVLSTPLTTSGGAATAYVNAGSPGVATLTAAASNGATVQGTVEFVAPLTSKATISLQSNPGTIASNTPGTTTQQATLRAVVLDGTALNNLVKNAQVAFSIVADSSGGSLTQPAVVTTGADGSASVNYIAGTSATALNGVQIKAAIQGGVSSASATTNLTVAQKSLFITAGTGNTVGTPSSATYQLDYAVFVTDAAGNAVSGTKLTASVVPTTYYKGVMGFIGTTGPWTPITHLACANEDTNGNGVLDAGEDTNHNGVLDPRIPLTVTSAVTTDASGQAVVSMVYPRDHAYWIDVNLVIRGQVAGSESTYTTLVHLPGLGTDYATQNQSPPGQISPYGSDATTCTNTN